MNEDSYISTSEVRSVFQNKYDSIINQNGTKVLMSHFGFFSQNLVSSIADKTEVLLLEGGIRPMVVKRLFSILIEGMQNIRIHSKKGKIDNQIGFVIISENDKHVNISFANVITFEDYERVERYIKKINSLSNSALKERYLEILNNGFLSDKNGAGIGLLTMRMKSGNLLDYGFYGLKGGNLLFTFKIKMKK